MLQIQQRGHPADGQPGTARRTLAAASNRYRGAEQVTVVNHLSVTVLARKGRREDGFKVGPRQPTSQHRQRVLEVNHLLQAGAEKVVGHGISRGSISLSFRHLLFQFLRVSNVANSMNFLAQ